MDVHRHRRQGGNLLLNVGPRGVDAQIPDEQLTRLEWLGRWINPNSSAIASSRPWIVPGTTTTEGADVRYTARDRTVFAFLRDASGTVTLPDVGPTRTTEVTTVGGAALPWKDTPSGLAIDLPPGSAGPEPAVVALRQVVARAS